MRKSIITSLVVALSVAGITVTPAAAEEVSVAISFADLDLSSPDGTAALEQRIDSAVRKVCSKPDLRLLKEMVAWEECKAAAKATAFEQLSILEPFDSIDLASSF